MRNTFRDREYRLNFIMYSIDSNIWDLCRISDIPLIIDLSKSHFAESISPEEKMSRNLYNLSHISEKSEKFVLN